MEETIHEDPEQEHLLDERQDLKAEVTEFRKKDKKCKKQIELISKPFPLRIGRYIIEKNSMPARSVAFEALASSRISIKQIGEE